MYNSRMTCPRGLFECPIVPDDGKKEFRCSADLTRPNEESAYANSIDIGAPGAIWLIR
jgi:hypothetical protein